MPAPGERKPCRKCGTDAVYFDDPGGDPRGAEEPFTVHRAPVPRRGWICTSLDCGLIELDEDLTRDPA